MLICVSRLLKAHWSVTRSDPTTNIRSNLPEIGVYCCLSFPSASTSWFAGLLYLWWCICPPFSVLAWEKHASILPYVGMHNPDIFFAIWSWMLMVESECMHNLVCNCPFPEFHFNDLNLGLCGLNHIWLRVKQSRIKSSKCHVELTSYRSGTGRWPPTCLPIQTRPCPPSYLSTPRHPYPWPAASLVELKDKVSTLVPCLTRISM